MRDGHLTYREVESFESLSTVWKFAQRTCPVIYMQGKNLGGAGVGGGYSGVYDEIWIADDVHAGETFPALRSPESMDIEACLIMHELAHALRSREEKGGGFPSAEWQRYLSAIRYFNFVQMDGTWMPEDYRRAIMQEETKTDLMAQRLTAQVAPRLIDQYRLAMVDNLSSYSTILWTGRWPDGKRQEWKRDNFAQLIKEVMTPPKPKSKLESLADKYGIKIKYPQIKWDAF